MPTKSTYGIQVTFTGPVTASQVLDWLQQQPAEQLVWVIAPGVLMSTHLLPAGELLLPARLALRQELTIKRLNRTVYSI